jgi:hypothetical protein
MHWQPALVAASTSEHSFLRAPSRAPGLPASKVSLNSGGGEEGRENRVLCYDHKIVCKGLPQVLPCGLLMLCVCIPANTSRHTAPHVSCICIPVAHARNPYTHLKVFDPSCLSLAIALSSLSSRMGDLSRTWR